MPELEITEEQAGYLDDLRDAIESEIVGPYGTVRRKDALQYLIDDFGAPDELGDGAEPGGAVEETDDPDDMDDTEPADGDASEEETDEDEDETGGEDEENDDDDETDAEETDEGAESEDEDDGNGDDMLDEMMSLMDTHDDKWTEADTEETKYEVELPDGETETVQTQDDVRALLFKHYR